MSAEKIIPSLAELHKSQSRRQLKPVMLLSSIVLFTVPLFVSNVAAKLIGFTGGVGFAASIFDIWGKEAFEAAAKFFSNLFKSEE